MSMLWAGVAAIARVAVWCGGAMLFAAAAIVTAEVLLRKGVGCCPWHRLRVLGSDEISALPVRGGDELVDGVRSGQRAGTCASTRSTAAWPRECARCSISSRCWCSASSLPHCSSAPGTWPSPATSKRSAPTTPLRLPLAWAQLPWFAGIALFFLALVLAVPALARGAAARRLRGGGGDRRCGDAGRGDRERARRPRHATRARQLGEVRGHARDDAAAAHRAARAQRAGRRRHGRSGPGAQPVLCLDAAAPRDGRDHLELLERVHPDRHPAVRDAGRDPAARGHRRARLQRHRAVAVLAARRPDARQHRLVRHVRGDLGLERRHGGDDRHRGAAPRSRSATTTSRCSSARSRPAARSAS